MWFCCEGRLNLDDNRIIFPQSEEQIMKQALKAREHKQLDEAIDLVRAAYQTKPTRRITLLYFDLLFEKQKMEEAYVLAEKHEEWFLSDNLYCTKYIETLIKAKQFIKAEALINRLVKKTKQSVISDECISYLQEDLEIARKDYNDCRKKKEIRIIQALSTLYTLSPPQQRELVHESRGYTSSAIQLAYQQALINQQTDELAKTLILDEMLKQGRQGEIVLDWFGEKRSLSLQQLEGFDDKPIVRRLMEKAEKDFSDNPSLAQLIQGELIIHLSMLYPFIEEVVTDEDDWLLLYLQQYGDGHADEVPLEMHKWFDKLTH